MTCERERWYPLSVLLVTAGYLSYAISKGIFILCALPVALLLIPFPAAKRKLLQGMLHGFLGFFTRRWLPWLGVYRVAEISGIEHTRNSTPAVIVANHRGFMDGLFILGLVPQTGVVIKAKDTRQPTYALLERHFDVVAVDKASRESVSASLDRCLKVLRHKANLLVFPEGTRARTGRLQRFTRAAFQLAAVAQVPVLPVVIHSTCPFMARVPGSIFPRGRNAFRIRFLSPEMMHSGEDVDMLTDRIYRRMATALKKLDAGTFWEVERPGHPTEPVQSALGMLASRPVGPNAQSAS